MPTTKPIALAFLLLTGACASNPGDRGSEGVSKKPLNGGVAEFRLTFYDGLALKGRVLLGATVDPIVIDRRLFEGGGVELKKVRACGKTELVKYFMGDLFPYHRADDIITIRRGYWYGKDASFPLFDTQTAQGPDCFEAELVLRAEDMRVAATLPIRVVRTDKPSAPPDGGAAPPKPPASDAGAP